MDKKYITVVKAVVAAIGLFLIGQSWFSFIFEYAQRDAVYEAMNGVDFHNLVYCINGGYLSIILLSLPVFAGTVIAMFVRGKRVFDLSAAVVTVFSCLALFVLCVALAAYMPSLYENDGDYDSELMLYATAFQSELVPVIAGALALLVNSVATLVSVALKKAECAEEKKLAAEVNE